MGRGALGFADKCMSDMDCEADERRIQYDLERETAERFCASDRDASTRVWLAYQAARAAGAPVHRGAAGVSASRVVLYTGTTIGGITGVVALVDVLVKGFKGEETLNVKPFLPAVVDSLTVESLRLFWNRRLILYAADKRNRAVRWFPAMGVSGTPDRRGSRLTVGIGGVFQRRHIDW